MSQRLTAFSGGGWHSLSALYGMIAGALDVLEDEGESRTINRLFEGVDTISANSGGAWALTALASSAGIQTAFETRSGSDAITSSGYLGQVKQAFEQLPRFGDFPETVSYLIYLMSPIGGYNYEWQRLVDDLIFTPAQDIPSGNFVSTEMLDWTQEKQLVIATGLSAVQSSVGVLPPRPLVVAKNPQKLWVINTVEAYASSTNIPNQTDIIPLSLEISNDSATDSIYRIPGSQGAQINYQSTSGALRSTSEVNPMGRASDLSLTSPSVMSSAVLAPYANVIPFAGNLAPLVSLRDSSIESQPRTLFLSNEQAAHAAAAENSLVRTMDGGFIDNSSLAYGLSSLHNEKGLKNDFKASSFINKAESPEETWSDVTLSNGKLIKLPFEVTMLFGIGLDGERLPENDSYIKQDFDVPIMQPNTVLFETDALTGLEANPTWSYQLDGTEWELQQWSIDVITTENKTFDIPGGFEGEISFFILSNPASDSMAFNSDVLDQYDQNYNNYRDALNTAEGSRLIEEAFNL